MRGVGPGNKAKKRVGTGNKANERGEDWKQG